MLGSPIDLVLRVIDKAAGPLRYINREFKKVDETVKATSKRFEHLGNIGRRLTTAGAGMAVAGGGLAYSLGLTDAVSASLDAEHALRSLGNVGELTDRQLKDIGNRVISIGKDTNQGVRDIIAGINTLVASGLDARVAVQFMPTIGKTATAELADINELAKTTFSVYDNLKVPINQLGKAMDVMTKSGKEGRFELRDMARYFPMLTAGAHSLGMTGVRAVSQLGAALQVAMKGAADPEEAARNFQNFIMKITSRETVKNFSKFGVDVKTEMNKALSAGADPLEHMLGVIQKITGGDKFKLAQLFADMQVTNFLVPMMANMKEYRRIRDATFGASGVVDKDFRNMMTTTREQFKLLKTNLAALLMPSLNSFFQNLNAVLVKINGSSAATKAVLGGVLGLFAGGTLLSGLGFLFSGMSNGVSALKGLASFAKGAGAGLRTLFTVMRLGRVATLAMSAATWLFSASLWACPITWIIAAIIALGVAVFLLIRYWKPITAFFKNLWGKIKELWGNAVTWMKDTGKNLILNFCQGMLAVINRPGEIMRAGLKKLRDLLPFSPAKEGPLRDLHKVKIMETLAASVNSAPLVHSVKGALSSARSAIAPSSAGARGGTITLNYSPTVNVGGDASRDDFLKMLKTHKDEIMRMIRDASRREERLAY